MSIRATEEVVCMRYQVRANIRMTISTLAGVIFWLVRILFADFLYLYVNPRTQSPTHYLDVTGYIFFLTGLTVGK